VLLGDAPDDLQAGSVRGRARRTALRGLLKLRPTLRRLSWTMIVDLQRDPVHEDAELEVDPLPGRRVLERVLGQVEQRFLHSFWIAVDASEGTGRMCAHAAAGHGAQASGHLVDQLCGID
jgi:hypothetical protein